MNTEQNYVGRGNYANTPPPMAQNAAKTPSTADGRMAEIWKPFPQLESLFEISSLGKVRCLKTGNPVKTRMNKGFEVLASFRIIEGKYYRPAIHRAVALAFVPNPDGLEWARAIDRSKPATHANNLQWVKKQVGLICDAKRSRVRTLAWSRLQPRQNEEIKLPVNQTYSSYILDRLLYEGRLSESEYRRTGIVACKDDSMSPQLAEGVEFVATPVAPYHYPSLVGKVVAVVIKAQRFAYYLGRVVSIDEDFVRVGRDNSEWPERIESRSVIASIARVVSVLETSVN